MPLDSVKLRRLEKLKENEQANACLSVQAHGEEPAVDLFKSPTSSPHT